MLAIKEMEFEEFVWVRDQLRELKKQVTRAADSRGVGGG